MKRPILKRTVRTIEVVTWTLEYEQVPEEEVAPSMESLSGEPPPNLTEAVDSLPSASDQKVEKFHTNENPPPKQ